MRLRNLTPVITILSAALFFISCNRFIPVDPLRFANETDSLSNLQITNPDNRELVVFTGSSSIRMWKDVQDYFPDKLILNTGFGGSHFSDLLYHLNNLVIQYNPDRIFIYEGDNDVGHGKCTRVVMKDARAVIREIQTTLPGVPVILISPKPSIRRWELKKDYDKLNRKLEQYATNTPGVEFIDMWKVMLDEKGNLKEDLFIEDGLHMNEKGYDLWAGEIEKYID